MWINLSKSDQARYAWQVFRAKEGWKGRLKEMIQGGRFPHACILEGPQGSGKELLGHVIARALLCESKEVFSCGHCIACQIMESGNHPDFFVVRPKKTKVLGVEDVREQIVEEAAIKPYRADRKVFLVPEAGEMTQAAQNALLKTLEEPPGQAVFLLLAQQAGQFLPTVRSRCPVISIPPLSESDVAQYLMDEKKVPEGEAHFLGEYAAGCIGRALQLWEEEGFLAMREDVLMKLAGFWQTPFSDVMLWPGQWAADQQASLFFDLVAMFFRDVLVEKQLPGSSFLLQKDRKEFITQAARSWSMTEVYRGITAVVRAKRQVQQNVNFQLALEAMLLEIKGERHV